MVTAVAPDPFTLSLVDDYPDPIFVKDEQLRYVYANKAYLQQMNVSLEQLVGSKAADVLPPETAKQCEELDRNIIQTGQPHRCETTIELADSRFQRGDFTLTPRKNGIGQVVGMMGVVRDVSVRYERELNLTVLAEFETGIDDRRLRPACACCKQLKNTKGEWETIRPSDSPVGEDRRLTHGLCGTCGENLYGIKC